MSLVCFVLWSFLGVEGWTEETDWSILALGSC
jgi:hypothetical protein